MVNSVVYITPVKFYQQSMNIQCYLCIMLYIVSVLYSHCSLPLLFHRSEENQTLPVQRLIKMYAIYSFLYHYVVLTFTILFFKYMFSETCLNRHALREKFCVEKDRVSDYTLPNTLEMVKLEWKSMSDNTGKWITEVSN